MPIREAALADLDAIKRIAVETEMFAADEVDMFDEMLAGSVDGSLDRHRWIVLDDAASGVVAAAYYAPEPFSDRVWNLYFLSASPARQGDGIGARLIDYIEIELRSLGPDSAQVLIVETSSTEQYARTRTFYEQQGFVEEARIRRFYGRDDDKVVFWKSLTDD